MCKKGVQLGCAKLGCAMVCKKGVQKGCAVKYKNWGVQCTPHPPLFAHPQGATFFKQTPPFLKQSAPFLKQTAPFLKQTSPFLKQTPPFLIKGVQK